MADDTPDTPDAPEPDATETETVEVPETLLDEVDNAQEQDGTPVPTQEDAEAGSDSAASGAAGAERAPRAERSASRQTARDTAAGAGGPKTIEERQAARLEHRRSNAAQRRAYRTRLKGKRDERRAAAPAVETPPAHEHGPGRPKVRQGIVVSDKPDKTVIVRIDVAKRHRRYGKIMRSSSKLHVHDEANDANAGDTVRVIESRPLSATKRWRLVEVVERAR